jgi:hypothetical protein
MYREWALHKAFLYGTRPGPTAPREVPLLELPPMKAGSQPPKSEISFFWFRS